MILNGQNWKNLRLEAKDLLAGFGRRFLNGRQTACRRIWRPDPESANRREFKPI